MQTGKGHDGPLAATNATVRRWIEAFNAHEAATLADLYTDDAELFDSGMNGPRHGRGEIESWFTWRFRSTPSITYTPHEQLLTEDGQVIVKWTASGTGPRFPGGIAHPFQVDGESRFTLQDDLIARQRGTYDHLSVLRQVIPLLKWFPEGIAHLAYSLYLWRNGPRKG